MRQDISDGEGTTPAPADPEPAGDAGSTESSGDRSNPDERDGGGRRGSAGSENDSGDDQGQLAYLGDHAKGAEMTYVDDQRGAEESGSPEGEAATADDAYGSGSDGGDSGGGEAVAAGGGAAGAA
jgi:hypothetical protein